MKKLTPFQRGLLHGIATNVIGGFPADWYKHLKPNSKRSFNLLVQRGYLVLDSLDYHVTELGRSVLK